MVCYSYRDWEYTKLIIVNIHLGCARTVKSLFIRRGQHCLCERPLRTRSVPGEWVRLTAAITTHKQRKRNHWHFQSRTLFTTEYMAKVHLLDLKRENEKSNQWKWNQCNSSILQTFQKIRVFIGIMEFNKMHDCCGSDYSNGVFGRIVRKCIQEITSIENHLSFGLAIAVALCIFIFLKWLQRWWRWFRFIPLRFFQLWCAIPWVCFVLFSSFLRLLVCNLSKVNLFID